MDETIETPVEAVEPTEAVLSTIVGEPDCDACQ